MLRIYSLALDVAREVGIVVRDIARHDVDLARQMRRSMASVTLNLAEGSGQTGGNRTQHYRVALGSLRETLAGMHTGVALGYLDDVDAGLLDRIDHVAAVLYKLTRK